MELIYADSTHKDLGILQDYAFDLAYGEDENDFELKVMLDNHVCEQDYILYVEGTEYGGIIDTISPDLSDSTVTYGGRTWHGVLNSKVIEPEEGCDYRICDGDAHEVLAELIEVLDLTDTFEVSDEESGIEITSYQYRYDLAYDGIRAMLDSVNAKLLMKWQGDKVLLWVELINNYSIDEEFDSSQISFTTKKYYNLCNHMVCMGQGDLKDRAVIHVFTDENGGIQPYATTDTPLQDSDYILDRSSQVLTGSQEITETYDYSSAEIVENYILIEKKPDDWDTNYTAYYEYDADGDDYDNIQENLEDVYTLQVQQPYDWSVNYKDYYYIEDVTYESVESVSETSYVVLTSKPSDWSTNYSDYFVKGDDDYDSVEEETVETYTKQTKRPSDWKTNYANYYVTDGVDYSSVSGDSKTIYVCQTVEPSDWKTSWKDAYCIYMTGDYVKCENVKLYKKKSPKWRKNTFFNQSTETVTPAWKKATRYTKTTKTQAPTFTTGKYYRKDVNEVPTWKANTYYTLEEEVDVGVTFQSNVYYQMVTDNYASLVEGAIEKFEEYYASDELEIELDSENQYDIGDIVGAYENVTGVFVAQPITKKIIKIERNNVSIEYEVKKNGS